MKKIAIQGAEELTRLIATPKRLKIAVGGRGGSKSVFFADCFLGFCNEGERLLCAREYQNSINESVHSLLSARAAELGYETLSVGKSQINSLAGGEIFYMGLARNIESVKSIHGVKRIWIEEGNTLSQYTLDTLFPSIREEGSEIWISMNRGSSTDPIAETILSRHEDAIEKDGFYEDDDVLIVQINYDQNPWFPDVLEKERRKDFRNMPRAKYDHIWGGRYADTVDNAIIFPEWFDACVDAHKKLGFDASGVEVVSHDPSDKGDAKGLAYLHGAVLKDVQATDDGDINTACDWALDYSNDVKADLFIWDGDGMGTGLRRQINDELSGKKRKIEMFKGSFEPYNPEQIYEPIDNEETEPKTNKDTFLNARAQGYWMLRDRMYRTWEAVELGKYHDPSELFSISSDIERLSQFRSEICRIPRKPNSSGKIQILSKAEMLKLGIKSPNMADAAMMAVSGITRARDKTSLNIAPPNQTNHWMAA